MMQATGDSARRLLFVLDVADVVVMTYSFPGPCVRGLLSRRPSLGFPGDN